MKLPRITNEYYPTSEEQSEVKFRKNNKKYFDLKNRFREINDINGLSRSEIKGLVADFLYKEMYIYHNLAIPSDSRVFKSLSTNLLHVLVPDPAQALALFFPLEQEKINLIKKSNDILYAR